MQRRKTKKIYVKDITIGGDSPIVIQSMTNTKTSDAKATIAQIKALEKAGCELVRVSVPNNESAQAIGEIISNVNIPVVADIHFDYKLALESIKNGVHGLRINPGNIGNEEKVIQVVNEAKKRNIKIRIGVNAGSLEKDLLDSMGRTPEAMVESAFRHIKILEKYDFYNTAVSLKASDIETTIKAYELFSSKSDYPLHLGITEAGTLKAGTIKSSIGIGYMLLNGIGDTIRVSLTADPVEEIYVAKEILKSIGLDNESIRIISCPTCARTDIDIIGLAEKVEKATANIKKNISVAIMGCAVNGPGEARDADLGIAGGKSEALLFKKGQIIRKVDEASIIEVLLEEIDKF
ncbi:MAG: flavodoxin-dependent (E)-4-hydroxy-3-methylbut-2-enyl-diphosphate synthase [Acetoanaerobium sp.]|jgi:(E)-4-hydroxy-3-methylbut-2-enyl-diphosphate synthase|uniref:flavodoxin-dependent (E)-4-hydroxy-3-methylbut-2-enyl-diphosphate synthase n=1 Tax=Acetoanaerobium noterae TaxID=745369 RepID=UPI001B6D7B9B|nr:flavodoxin-dependent (E)-4-hydroxy-3-methylbut-2-enyl-diphosphate synthase [Acetoanaerobium sp.]MBP9499374.1 flavodoxin-dependent (E)-4-hydroxy-3-methylbut-2-enyl-diphosphate synthase [Acetoanaerobium sp.]MBP9561962.1 flavodoxin-dependent (E)-4-hydroxy-3-methylbut-2-enyl-diphosphate synthase [Acetoanaerobium sp.]